MNTNPRQVMSRKYSLDLTRPKQKDPVATRKLSLHFATSPTLPTLVFLSKELTVNQLEDQ
jgi:hypothetical protein